MVADNRASVARPEVERLMRDRLALMHDVARHVQEEDLARRRAEERGPFADAPGLATLRRRIDGLNRDLLGALAEARPWLADAGTRDQFRQRAREVLTGEGITDAVRAAAMSSLVPPPQH